MTTDFNYNNKTIDSGGPIKPSGIDQPGDPRTRVDFYSDIKLIPNPYVGMIITVKTDETNQNKMTDYKVISLKPNALGIANSVIDRVQRYIDYLGVSTGGNGLTTEQAQQLQTAYEHSQSVHVSSEDLSNITSTINLNSGKISELNSQMNTITNRVDNIENTVEPQWNDIPKLSFNGDVTSMSKTTYCTLDFTYRSNTMCYYGKAKLKWQGSSSLTYPKKNYTIRLLEKDGKTKKYINFKGWGRQEKFVLKANYVDSLHLRNLAGARIA